MMKPKLVIWLCLLVACSTDNAVTPANDDPQDLVMMTATLWDKPFWGVEYCDGGAGPTTAPPSFWAKRSSDGARFDADVAGVAAASFWAKRTSDGARFDADLSDVIYRSGKPSPLGFDTTLFTGEALYVHRDRGNGTIIITRFDDVEITGSIEATLVHQRNVTQTVTFVGTFSADPFLGTVSVTGMIDGAPFVSDIGEEYFPRARARVCIEDAYFSEGTGASIAITMEKISRSFLGSYPVFSTHGPATITVESGGEFYNGVSGSVDILGVDSVAVEDSLGTVIRYNRVITDATFNLIGVNLIVFGDENKDTVRVNNGELSLPGPLPGP
ncbi:MAG: hypothetical protein O7D32_09645 [bacterium]|nr:hypothetical protein [bacterium]